VVPESANPLTCRHGRIIPYGNTWWCDSLKDPSCTPDELQDLRNSITERLSELRLEAQVEASAPRTIKEYETKLLCVNDEIARI
jgi:hypothetical protein